MIPPKNKLLRKPLEPPHKQVIKKPATMGGKGGTVSCVRLDKKKAPGKSGGVG